MSEKWLTDPKIDSSESSDSHPEVEALMDRLQEIEPKEMAEALYHLESFKQVPHLMIKIPQGQNQNGESKFYFSQGLKREIESIYIELADHLRKKSSGSMDLMNAVFDFFSKTLSSLLEVPYLTSMN